MHLIMPCGCALEVFWSSGTQAARHEWALRAPWRALARPVMATHTHRPHATVPAALILASGSPITPFITLWPGLHEHDVCGVEALRLIPISPKLALPFPSHFGPSGRREGEERLRPPRPTPKERKQNGRVLFAGAAIAVDVA